MRGVRAALITELSHSVMRLALAAHRAERGSFSAPPALAWLRDDKSADEVVRESPT